MALVGLHLAATSPARAADLYGTGTYERHAYPADDPRYSEIYEIPRHDRYDDAYAPNEVRRDERYDDGRYVSQDRRDRYYDAGRPIEPDRYVARDVARDNGRYVDRDDARYGARDYERRIYRDAPPPDGYAERAAGSPPLSLKDSPAAAEPYAAPTHDKADRYDERRFGRYDYDSGRVRSHDLRGYRDDPYRRAPPRYRNDFDRRDYVCLGRRDMKRALRSDGWRGFIDFDFSPGSDRARVNARRTFDGRRFILTLDGCTGDIIAALPAEPRYNRW